MKPQPYRCPLGKLQPRVTDLDAMNYFDLAGSWDITDYAAVRMGVNNLFDEEPAFAGSDRSAPRRTRTFDPLIKSQLLYQLS